MKITKIGHCCMLVETKGKRILIDPGCFTVEKHASLVGIDCILFSHDHADHYHLESLKEVLQINQNVLICANPSVAALLKEAGIHHEVLGHGQAAQLGDIAIMGIGEKHALMHAEFKQAQNTGFMIDDRFWYPGDAFTNPEREVEILALPVAGPWMKISEAIDYAILLKPKSVFPVHDYLRLASQHTIPQEILAKHGIAFTPLAEGESWQE